MNKSRLMILGVAVVAAVGAGYLAKNMITAPAPQVIVEKSAEPAMHLSNVLVVSRNVPMGSSVDGALRWQQWPSESLNPNFITRTKEPDAMEKLNGSVARTALYEGEPLRRSQLIGKGQSYMSSVLPSGTRAVATRIAADTSAGGFILPNDHVDVIMTRRSDEAAATGGFITETILKNIRVLAIDQTIQENEEGQRVKVGETATLELTPEQAEIITVAQQLADRLTLALRSVADADEKSEDVGAYLVNGVGSGNAVRLIKSGQISVVGARR